MAIYLYLELSIFMFLCYLFAYVKLSIKNLLTYLLTLLKYTLYNNSVNFVSANGAIEDYSDVGTPYQYPYFGDIILDPGSLDSYQTDYDQELIPNGRQLGTALYKRARIFIGKRENVDKRRRRTYIGRRSFSKRRVDALLLKDRNEEAKPEDGMLSSMEESTTIGAGSNKNTNMESNQVLLEDRSDEKRARSFIGKRSDSEHRS